MAALHGVLTGKTVLVTGAGGPVTVTHPDVTRYFMTARVGHPAAPAGYGDGAGGEVFVLNMGTPIKVAELADPAPTVGAIRQLTDLYGGSAGAGAVEDKEVGDLLGTGLLRYDRLGTGPGFAGPCAF